MQNEDLSQLTTREIAARIHALRWSIGPNGENYKHNEQQAEPLITEWNRRLRELNKKFGKSWKDKTFRGFPRTY